jgi:mannose-6-phosphate isomerase-like protein (cupin superfamily)
MSRLIKVLQEKEIEPDEKETKSPTGFVGDIEEQTLKNKNFRQVLFTGKHAQLVLMSVPEDEELGDEVHEDVDQFFRIEKGRAKFVFDEKEEHVVGDGDAVIVPAGTHHNVINVGPGDLKLYTIYSPPNHPEGTIQKTKADAEAAEEQKKNEEKKRRTLTGVLKELKQ